MDAERFDALTRLLTSARGRRGLLSGLAGLGALAIAAPAAAGCGPCERKTRRGCKPRKDNTICRQNGCCRSGRCFFAPDCAGADQPCTSNPNGCCSDPGTCIVTTCTAGVKGSPCFGDQDCRSGTICVGYRCK